MKHGIDHLDTVYLVQLLVEYIVYMFITKDIINVSFIMSVWI